jgi:peptidoglycan-N-acetylglucosamine deacetylase
MGAGPIAPAAATSCPSGLVALTFDDGPDPGTEATARVLDHLKAKQAKATFFLVGQQIGWWPSLPKRTVAEGHRVANHTFTHPNLTTLSSAAVRDEFTRTNQAFAAAGLPKPNLQRPPFGATNATVNAVGEELGLTQVLWNVDARDWENPPPGIIRARIRSQLRPNAIIVILLHDAWTQNTAAAVPGVIDDLRADGYCLAFIQPSSQMVPGIGKIALVPTEAGTSQPPIEEPPPVVISPHDRVTTSTGATYPVSGTDVARGTDQLVVYTPAVGTVTPTNRWGAEAAVVNGAVVTMVDRAPTDAPPLAIPRDGVVLSGHGKARDWMLANLKVGTGVTVPGVPPPASAPPPAPEPPPPSSVVTESGASYPVSGTNVSRGTDQLVIYTPAAGKRTPTDRWGAEAAVVNGKVVAMVDRAAKNTKALTIPSDGVVLSGSGSARDWMLVNLRVGVSVSVPGAR